MDIAVFDSIQSLLPVGFHMWATFVLIAGAVIAYAWDRIPLELTSLVVLALLLVLFYFFPLSATPNGAAVNIDTLLSGFSNPALISVVTLLVLGQAVVQTGALNEIAAIILRMSRNNAPLSIGACLIVVLLISAVLNNTPVVVIFIPILGALVRILKVSPSRVMMPLSFVAIAGGMMTLIGSSTNILVSGMLPGLGLEPLGFFDFTIPGGILASIALIYILFIVPWILPDRASLANNLTDADNRQFIAQIVVDYTSELIGQTIETGTLPNYPQINLRMIQRGEHAYLPPFEEHMALRAGDIIVLGGTRKDIAHLLSAEPDMMLQHLPDLSAEDEASEGNALSDARAQMSLAEVVIAPSSRMVGRNLEQIAFHHTHNCLVLGIQRHSRVIRARVTEIKLAAGDVLLIFGTRDDIFALQNDNDLLLMEYSTEDIHTGAKGKRAATIFVAVAGLAAFDVMPITISALLGVCATLITGCISLRQAARAIDMQIILLIATSLALGIALQATGGATYLAHLLVTAMDGAPAYMIASALFLLMLLVTNVLSNNASAVLFTPIAVQAAYELGAAPEMFIYAVIFACNCSFITPIGYQTNLLVMGPGHYRFSDFMRAGIPLGILVWLSYSMLVYFVPEIFHHG